MGKQMLSIDKKKFLKKAVYVCGSALLLINSSTGVVSAAVMNQKSVQSSQVSPRAGLADISILTNASLVSTTGNDMVANTEGNFDLSLKYTGTGLATVGLTDNKVLVYALPTELQGKLVGGSTVDIQANLLPITPGDIPGVSVAFDALGVALNALDALLDIPTVLAAYDELKEVQEFGQYNVSALPATVSDDGKTISVDFTQGFGEYVRQVYGTLFYPLRIAIDGIPTGSSLIAPLVEVAKAAATTLFDIIDAVAMGSSNILDSALNGNLLGSMTGTLKTTVSHPETETATVKAAAISDATITANVLTMIEQDGESVTLNFPITVTDPLLDYTVAAPVITAAIAGETQLMGQVTLATPIPTGTTFTAVATMPDGTERTGTVNALGEFVIATDPLIADESISVKIVAMNGEFTKNSLATQVVVTNAESKNPLADYNVSAPVIDEVLNGAVQVSGNVELTMPIPGGTTFMAVATMPNGTIKTGVVDSSGNFVISTDELITGQSITVKIVATNGEFTKDSDSITTVVMNPDNENPLIDYNIAIPTVAALTAGDTIVNGQVVLETPIPTGTSFEAVVTFSDGTKKYAAVAADGTFSVPTATLVGGETVQVAIIATNGDYTKSGDAISVLVGDGEATDPLADYIVTMPETDLATAGDQQVSGKVNLNIPIPEGTTFEVVVVFPGGITKTGTLDSNGKFTVVLDTPLVENSTFEVQVIATNGEFTKAGPTQIVTVVPAIPTNPLENYEVATPIVHPVVEGATSIEGNVNLVMPAPTGTSFEAVVTFPNGQTSMSIVEANGDFSIPADNSLVAGMELTVKIIAKNGLNIKESQEVMLEVVGPTETNPLADYPVSAPIVDPVIAGDTSVSGQVEITQPVPEGTTFEAIVTLPDGTTVKAPVDETGHFIIEVAALTAGTEIKVTVLATNGEFTKESTPVTMMVDDRWLESESPLSSYDISSPDVNEIQSGDTEVNGSAVLVQPIPDGTTFKIVVQLADGTVISPLTADGKFATKTRKLISGEKVKVQLVATNGDYQKSGKFVTMTVVDKSSNSEAGGSGNLPQTGSKFGIAGIIGLVLLVITTFLGRFLPLKDETSDK